MRFFSLPAALLATLAVGAVAQIDLDITSKDSIKSAAKDIAASLMNIYTTQLELPVYGIPGLLPPPYYWWEAGGMMGVMLDYWHVTGDTTWNKYVSEAMLFQTGPDENYMPPNQSKSLGNDDQSFWGFAAMTAAEFNFPNPPPDQPQWLALAQATWNSQQLRWNMETCAGGLNWQIYTTNNGYTYKHTPSNAAFLNLGARLHAYTGNETYADWTVKTWQWIDDMGLIGGNGGWTIFDGVDEKDNCSSVAHTLWSYNFGMMLNAAAVMWNATQDEIWRTRAVGIWNATQVFWGDDMIFKEVTCENVKIPETGEMKMTCNNDQRSFKAYTIRWFAVSTKWAPWLYEMMEPYFQSNAKAVALQCNPNDIGADCGQRWDVGSFFNTTGPGEQMSALEAINTLLVQGERGPVTAKSGGTSIGDPSAGTAGDFGADGAPPPLGDITTADRAGAGVLTALVLVLMLSGTYWMVV